MLYSKRIKELRLEKKFSQQELGDMIGITKVSICGYENGTRTPSLETFDILADILETSTDYLLGRTDKRNIETKQQDISIDDYSIIKKFRNHNHLYYKMIKDPRRYISLINKKLNS